MYVYGAGLFYVCCVAAVVIDSVYLCALEC